MNRIFVKRSLLTAAEIIQRAKSAHNSQGHLISRSACGVQARETVRITTQQLHHARVPTDGEWITAQTDAILPVRRAERA